MVSVSITLDDEEFSRLSRQSWINWSEIAREIVTKKEIFERYMVEGKLTKEDLAFCDSIDWHPVDELPMKEEYIAKLLKIRTGKKVKVNTTAELRQRLGL